MDNEIQQPRYYLPSVKKMRLLLMICAILYTYRINIGLQNLNGIALGFAFPALYIISGYIVLRDSQDIEKRILRAIGRTAICFGILAVTYFGLSLAFEPAATLAAAASKRVWFDFLVLNTWSFPIGSTIWFVQALLYAYIGIYIFYKLKLLRFDIYIAAFCLVITLITGELSSVVGFRLLWHTYLGGNFLTRALPYILIGGFIHRKRKFFGRLGRRRCGIIAIGGIVLTVGEFLALTLTGNDAYTSHMLGMGFVAVAICLFCFYMSGMKVRSKPLKSLSRFELAIPFFASSPLYYLLGRVAQTDAELFYVLGNLAGIITLMLSFAVLYLYIFVPYVIRTVPYLIRDALCRLWDAIRSIPYRIRDALYRRKSMSHRRKMQRRRRR